MVFASAADLLVLELEQGRRHVVTEVVLRSRGSAQQKVRPSQRRGSRSDACAAARPSRSCGLGAERHE
eukprot:8734775-Heterocapsa_arctica.AAC.1